MRALLLLVLVSCGRAHLATTSVHADRSFVRDQCSLLTGVRHETCMRLGPPRAPERTAWATASWWLYESRHWEPVPNSVAVGPQVVCASYVAFTPDRVVESDEQCHRVKRYEP